MQMMKTINLGMEDEEKYEDYGVEGDEEVLKIMRTTGRDTPLYWPSEIEIPITSETAATNRAAVAISLII